MKQRNTWKMRLSVLLMVVMMLNMTITAFAGWENEDGGWRYYKSDGTMIRDQEAKIREKWYSFDEDGFMRTGWLEHLRGGDSFYTVPPEHSLAESQWVKIGEDWYYFKEITETEDGITGGAVKSKDGLPKWKAIQGKYYCFDERGVMFSDEVLDIDGTPFYASKNGELVSQSWVCLDENGHECTHTDGTGCDCSWYYLQTIKVENEELTGGMVVADKDEGIKEKVIANKTYAFDEEGKMISRDFNPNTGHYFQGMGEMAVNKYLLTSDGWYRFDSSGKGTRYAASSSNAAPYPEVSSIAPVDEKVNAVIGQEGVELSFKVELASDSNAANKTLTKDHDFWITCTNGRTSNLQVEAGNICKLSYSAGKKDGVEKVYLWIDGVRSEPANVNVTLTSSEESSDEIKAEDVKDAIDNILANPEMDVQGAVESLAGVYENASDTVKKEVQSQLLKEVTNNPSSTGLKELEKNYVEENKITLYDPAVSSEAMEQLGEDSVEVVGAGLNAEEGESVQLQVSVPEKDSWAVEGNYRSTIAFDIQFMIMASGGDEMTNMPLLKIPVVISMKVPAGFTNADKLINIHDGEEIEVDFKVQGGKVYFVTDRFSTYVFAITDKPASTTSSGGGGKNNVNSEIESAMNAGSQSGEWIQDANGWWIRLNDGTYPVNTWMYLDYNRVYKWYRFDMSGYIRTGWFTDADGHIYYLNPISDGTKGAMMTGWQFIDGYWYYFNPTSDGTQGALLVNTTTPDGYVVNEKGQWIQ